MYAGQSLDVVATLRPVRRALGLRGLLRWGVRGAGAGLLMVVLLFLAARAGALPAVLPLGLLLPVGGTLAGSAIGLRRWPRNEAAARVVDRQFGLQDRLTTALEYQAASGPLVALQRADVTRRMEGLPLRQIGRDRALGREVAAVALTALLLAAVLVVGGGTRGTVGAAAGTARDAARIQRVTRAGLTALQQRVRQGLAARAHQDAAQRRIAAALSTLRRELLHLTTRREALRAISATQAQLQHIAAGLHPVRPAAATHLASALAGSMTPAERAAGAAGGSRASTATAAALSRLAAQLGRMTPAERAALAERLARAANSTTGSGLAAPLQAAAHALAYGDAHSAAGALRAAAGTLQRSPGAQAAQRTATSAASSLDTLKSAVSGVQSQTSSAATSGSVARRTGTALPSGGATAPATGGGTATGGAPGAGGSGTKGSPGHATGAGAATTGGQGAGSGKAGITGNGQGVGSGGHGGTGGHGAGGSRGNSGPSGLARYATVYNITRLGSGPSTSTTGPNGTPGSGPIVPYHQVLAQYEASAHAALDRSPLPPGLQSYVRRYFNAISH